MKKKLALTISTLVLCVCLAILAFCGTLDTFTSRLGTGAVHAQNEKYLNATFNKALAGFGVMSGIKAGLAVIEGSSVGVSVGATVKLEVGDVVQSVYDYVDIAWRTLLTGCITILSIQYLLKAATVVDGYILGVTLLIFGVSLMLRWWANSWYRGRDIVRALLSLSVVALMAVLYILPVSVWGAAKLSEIITQPTILEAQQGFSETKTALFPDDEVLPEGLIDRVKHIPDRIFQIAEDLKARSSQMAVWTIKLITGYIFDCIVFPMILVVLLLWLTRSVTRYIFQKNLQSSLIHDLRRILVKQD